MRSSTWLIRGSLVTLLAAITLGGCGSSSGKGSGTGGHGGTAGSGGTSGGGGTSATDGGGGAGGTCTPMAGNVATVDAGTRWGCFETACMTQLAACAADCTCNNAVLTALQCVATGSQQLTCFAPLASTGAPGMALGLCLFTSTQACTPAPDGGPDASTDGGADAPGEGGGGSDAPGEGHADASGQGG